LPPATLADALAAGRLPLATALKYACGIAKSLRDLHRDRQVHGSVNAACVALQPSGAELMRPRKNREAGGAAGDIAAFGGLLYEMLTGSRPPTGASASTYHSGGPRTGPGAVRSAAIRLAGRCLDPLNVPVSMQHLTNEIRVLSVLAHQYETIGNRLPASPIPTRAAPSPPFLVSSQPIVKSTTLGPTNETPMAPGGPDTFGRVQERRAELAPVGNRCPKCESTAVYVSRPRSRFENLLVRWNIPIIRCHRCYHRYLIFSCIKFSKEMPIGNERATPTGRPFRRRKK
jgi:hypothetical protein